MSTRCMAAFNKRLDEEFDASKSHLPNRADWLDGRWAGLAAAPKNSDRRGETGVPEDVLKKVGKALTTAPEGFHLHKTIARQLEAKAKMFETGEGFDWATAEALAFGTLLDEGLDVRLSGQDSSRGTFSQRHAALVDQETEERYLPLNHIREGQGEFEVIDTLLSEEAVLGFEYGYSTAEPQSARAVGSAVRRFRQWRAGGDRPVHRLGRNEMAAHVGPGDAAAAWL